MCMSTVRGYPRTRERMCACGHVDVWLRSASCAERSGQVEGRSSKHSQGSDVTPGYPPMKWWYVMAILCIYMYIYIYIYIYRRTSDDEIELRWDSSVGVWWPKSRAPSWPHLLVPMTLVRMRISLRILTHAWCTNTTYHYRIWPTHGSFLIGFVSNWSQF